MTESEYLEMPWSIEDTIENLNKIREILKVMLIRKNLDGKASDDVKELEFDFDRAINALEKIDNIKKIIDCTIICNDANKSKYDAIRKIVEE